MSWSNLWRNGFQKIGLGDQPSSYQNEVLNIGFYYRKVFEISHILFSYLVSYTNINSQGRFAGLSLYVKKRRRYTRFHIVLQGRTTATTFELYNNLYKIWGSFHLLQWTIKWSFISQRLWSRKCSHWALWSICRGKTDWGWNLKQITAN